MAAFFSRILNMSLTGSVVIGIVLVARFLLKRSPKIYSYALWAVVLFRLLCPISFSAPISMLNLVQPEVTVASERTSVVTFVPTVQTPADTEPEFQQMAPVVEAQPKTLETKEVISIIWLVGVGAMAACSVVQYLHLRKRLVGAMRYRDNVYLSDYIESPFVMGIISPKIYMPSAIPAQERKYILAHERHHIRRGDPVWKLLGYAALCIHWFNPLVWAAFILAGKDMEMSCDEAVIRKFGPEIRADYSASLLRLATHRNTIAGMPLAFGEGDTKGRVMNMAKWKKPKIWASMICLVMCAVILVACAVNPEEAGSMDGVNATMLTGQVTADNGLNIREKPNEKSPIVDNYAYGTIVTIQETRNDWGRTDKGWIDMSFVALIDNTTAEEPREVTISFKTKFHDLSFSLPRGWQPQVEGDELTFTDGNQTFGGLFLEEGTTGDIPERWANLAYMSGSSTLADAEYCMIEESPESSRDYIQDFRYYHNGNTYHLWLYYENTTIEERESVASTVTFRGEQTATVSTQAAETTQPTAFYQDAEERLAQCKAVLDQVQSGAQALQCVRKSDYDTGIIQYWKNEGDWMTIQNHSDDSIVAYLHCGGAYYSNIAMTDDGVIGARDDNGMVLWEECDKPESFHIPWLSRYAWNDEAVEYLGTENKDGQSRIRLHIREPFPGYESGTPYYDVTMVFGDSGAFLQAELEVNQGLGGFFTETETISSLDGSVVADKLQQEYQRSIG